MMVWLNGKMLAEEDARISVFDRGFTVGDGIFETVNVKSGVPFALTRHLARLRLSAIGLGLPEPDVAAIRAGASAVLEAAGQPIRGLLRISVSAGAGPMASGRNVKTVPTVVVALAPPADPDPAVAVVTVPWLRNQDGGLAGLKTTSYAENVRALAYARERGGGEAVFANTAGELCEGAGSNIFFVTSGRLLTPRLSGGCLAGVTRALVLEWFGAVEEDWPMSALADAEEAFLTSTTRDIQPIRSVDGQDLPSCPGSVTEKVAMVYAAQAVGCHDPCPDQHLEP
jgi:branched-chain amino acid aminotransferase